MAVLHHYVPAHYPRRAGMPPVAAAVLGYIAGFALAVVPCLMLTHRIVPHLLPLGSQLIGPQTATTMALTAAGVVGLATSVWALARNTSRR